ncbi:transcription factor HES-3 [Loxodonta africana]|uniref:transcription factor HES-3 n=1 Tax=Loxodonta africana TaxID=9785 RepID=UPI0030CFC4E4
MEKKRRARINVSLEQLKSLLEKHYSHQIRKRKLEKADILELSVKYMKSLQSSVQGLGPAPGGAEYPSGFRGCLPGVSHLLRSGEEGGGLHCPLVPERAGGSTMDSAGPGSCPGAPELRGPCARSVWAAALAPTTGGPESPPPRLLLPGGSPGPSTGVPASQPVSRRRPEIPGPGLRVWRPWGSAPPRGHAAVGRSRSAAAQSGPLAARRIAAPPRPIQPAAGARFPPAQSTPGPAPLARDPHPTPTPEPARLPPTPTPSARGRAHCENRLSKPYL